MQGIKQFKRGIEVLKSTKANMKMQHIDLLLYLATEHPEPVTFADIQRTCKTSSASTTRNTKLLGQDMIMRPDTREWKDQGLGLVHVFPNPYNTRQFMAKLTDTGVKLMKELDMAVMSMSKGTTNGI